jgi:formate dehydrogenase
MGGHGSLAFWLMECINALSGNLDRRGGTLVGRGVMDFPRFGVKHGVLMRDDRSRIGGFPSVNDAFPGGLLADEILTPGPKQVRALFVTGGNPLLTMANAGRLAGVRIARAAGGARHPSTEIASAVLPSGGRSSA